MMRRGICHIFGASPEFVPVPDIKPGDLCIAADGGWQTLEKLGVSSDMAIGDFDSSLPPEGIPIARLDPVKDITDLYAAIQIGKERSFRSFRLYGALGGSWGHSAANLQILAGLAKEGYNAIILAENARVYALRNNHLLLSALHGRRVSILAFGGSASGVTLKGMRYPLHDAELDCFFPLGVSNELTGEAAEIAVAHGTLLVIQEVL
ncbi:MAG: thiamine diphosphokinase [Oscillospiraceae bacterium]|jgi:thiamine pyrophosphokinase|nr:thiamine diphosphokinase [Oscillospiraceae bacterium]